MKVGTILLVSLLVLILSGITIADSKGLQITEKNASISLLFVQTAEKGSFIAGAGDTYTLNLQNATPYTFYFSDRPYRIAGSFSNKKFIDMMNWSSAPNAAITLPGANASEDTVIVELSHPEYDATSGDMTYTARIIKNYQEGNLSDFFPNVDEKIPGSFDQVTLFIDSYTFTPTIDPIPDSFPIPTVPTLLGDTFPCPGPCIDEPTISPTPALTQTYPGSNSPFPCIVCFP